MVAVNKDIHPGSLDVLEQALAAESRVRPQVLVTPLTACGALGREADCRCWLKLENRQATGSFKARGAMSFMRALSQRPAGVVTASTGNHGLAVAWAGKRMRVPVTVVVPENVSGHKARNLEAAGATLVSWGDDVVKSEARARDLARESGYIYLPPYNDLRVVAGQAGVGLEVENQLGFPDYVMVPVGGGGLVAGVAGWFRGRGASTRVVGCQPENSDVMAASVEAGRILEQPSRPTLASAAAGGVEADSVTFALCRDLVDSWIRVSEKEIADAMDLVSRVAGFAVEGAAALPVAAIMKNPQMVAGKTVVLVISGGNTDMSQP
ncbi:MAG TPA: pyridoxal-phosphate dependent enzyme [Candidatus Aminicenantes bacterium]|nr:pyridoxal-phosphate dependent enzyme [Candidatus Aminicenantes bacterium]